MVELEKINHDELIEDLFREQEPSWIPRTLTCPYDDISHSLVTLRWLPAYALDFLKELKDSLLFLKDYVQDAAFRHLNPGSSGDYP